MGEIFQNSADKATMQLLQLSLQIKQKNANLISKRTWLIEDIFVTLLLGKEDMQPLLIKLLQISFGVM